MIFFIGSVVLLVLASFVIWPLLVFYGKNSKSRKSHYEKYHGSGSHRDRHDEPDKEKGPYYHDKKGWSHHSRSGSGSGRSSRTSRDFGLDSSDFDPDTVKATAVEGSWDNFFGDSDENEPQFNRAGDTRQNRPPKPFAKVLRHDSLTLAVDGESYRYQCVSIDEGS